MKHLITALRWRRALAYPKVAEPLLELAFGAAVIVSVEHPQEDALAKTTWTDEDDIPRLLLQFRDIHRLVHIIYVLLNHCSEIRDSIWNFLDILHHRQLN